MPYNRWNRDKMKKLIINSGITVGVTLLQFMLLLSLMHLLYLVRDAYVHSVNIDLYWGRNLWFGSRYLFLPSFTLANIAVLFINRLKIVLLINALLLVYVSYMWLGTHASYPYRSLAIYVIFIVLFCIGACFIYQIKIKTRPPE